MYNKFRNTRKDGIWGRIFLRKLAFFPRQFTSPAACTLRMVGSNPKTAKSKIFLLFADLMNIREPFALQQYNVSEPLYKTLLLSIWFPLYSPQRIAPSRGYNRLIGSNTPRPVIPGPTKNQNGNAPHPSAHVGLDSLPKEHLGKFVLPGTHDLKYMHANQSS